MTEPAELVLAYSSRIDRRLVVVGSAAEHALGDQLVHPQVGLVQPEAPHVDRRSIPSALEVRRDVLGHHRAHFLEHLAALLAEDSSCGSRSPSSHELRKPKLLRMLFENCVASLRAEDLQRSSATASSARSTTSAVHASPKMKWQSRSRS